MFSARELGSTRLKLIDLKKYKIMNTILLSATSEMAVASDPLMPLLMKNIMVSLVIIALLAFLGRSAGNIGYTGEDK
jgi:hypothetical protein